MNLSIFSSLLYFLIAVRATEWVEKRSITTVDMASIDSQIYVISKLLYNLIERAVDCPSLTQLFGAAPSSFSIAFISTPGGNLITPPQPLIGPIISAISPTVLAQLLNATARSSIASEFKGDTPDWYASLPTGVKSYIGALNAQITRGSVIISGAVVAKTTLPVSSGALNSAIASGSNLGSEFAAVSASQISVVTGNIETSTSKALAAAPYATWWNCR